MAALQHKVKEHDDRIRTLEINYEEFRASNTREHRMTQWTKIGLIIVVLM